MHGYTYRLDPGDEGTAGWGNESHGAPLVVRLQ